MSDIIKSAIFVWGVVLVIEALMYLCYRLYRKKFEKEKEHSEAQVLMFRVATSSMVSLMIVGVIVLLVCFVYQWQEVLNYNVLIQ